jgi:HEPN domain-containing protein
MSGTIDRHRWTEVLQWLVFVDQDIHVVELVMAEPSPSFGPAAFHCQQAAEKMAKALLVAHGSKVPKIHDLEVLTGLVKEVDAEAGESLAALASLSSWYVTVRYPTVEAQFEPTSEDVRLVIPRLKEMRRYIDSLAPKV